MYFMGSLMPRHRTLTLQVRRPPQKTELALIDVFLFQFVSSSLCCARGRCLNKRPRSFAYTIQYTTSVACGYVDARMIGPFIAEQFKHSAHKPGKSPAMHNRLLATRTIARQSKVPRPPTRRNTHTRIAKVKLKRVKACPSDQKEASRIQDSGPFSLQNLGNPKDSHRSDKEGALSIAEAYAGGIVRAYGASKNRSPSTRKRAPAGFPPDLPAPREGSPSLAPRPPCASHCAAAPA